MGVNTNRLYLYVEIGISQHYNHVAMAVVVSFLYDIGEPEHA